MKTQIIDALFALVNQRPGLDFADYGDISAYRSESRSITKDKHHARELLRAVEGASGITAENIIEASRHAFSGRLTITVDNGAVKVDYCTGQYFPTEYRKAICAVMAACLWYHWRDTSMPDPIKITTPHGTDTVYGPRKESAVDYLRRVARRSFSRAVAATWFH